MDPKTPAHPPHPAQPRDAMPSAAPSTPETIGAPATGDASANAVTSTAAAASDGAAARRTSAAPFGWTAAGDERSQAMCALLAQNWWAVALRGVFAILFGLFALFAPGATLLSLAIFFAAYLLVDGVFGIIAAVRAARREERWGLLLAEGVLDIAMGVVAFLFPIGAVFAFVIVTAVWALVTGGLMLAAAFRLSARHGRWWAALSGVASIIFGVLLILAPVTGAVVLAWWAGAYALVFGATLIGLAFKLKGERDREAGVPRGAAAAR
jgi:uncharacterized membrane protein HdeD (DUF308 family)